MAWTDRLRRKTAPTPPNTRPRSRSGRAHHGGFLDFEELNSELIHPYSHQVFDRMYRTDGDCRRSLAMVCNPIIAGVFAIEPYGGDDADQKARDHAKLVEWVLWEYLSPNFALHLHEALPLFTRSGFAPFEQVWQPAEHDGRQVLVPRKLCLMLPKSIWQWEQDDLGDLAAITQLLPTGGPNGEPTDGMIRIDAQDLVYYRVGQEGDNFEGVSLLRPAFKHWFFKDGIERLDVLGIEREATGYPVLYPPANKLNSGEAEEVLDQIGNLRAGEGSSVVMPGPKAGTTDKETDAWLLEVLGLGGEGVRKVMDRLSYESDKIAAGVIAEFMRLGQAGEGARATADVQQDPFHIGVHALSKVLLAPWNELLIPRIITANFGDADGFPTLLMERPDSTSLTELASATSSLVSSGLLTPDPALEDHLRDRASFPAADPRVRAEREQQRAEDRELQVEQTKAAIEGGKGRSGTEDTDPKKTAAAPAVEVHVARVPGDDTDPACEGPATHGRRGPREPRWWERKMSLAKVEDAIDGARHRIIDAAGPAARDLAIEVAHAVHTDPQALPDFDLAPLEGAIADQLVALYVTGRQTVVEELAAQGAAATASRFSAQNGIPAELLHRARLAAQAILARLRALVGRLGLRGGKPLGDLQAAAEREAAAALKAEAQVHAAPALTEGRSDEADDHANDIVGSRYTSILDTNRCEECDRADDDVLRPLQDPVRLKRRPPNRDCYGGDRCRCLEFFQLASETAPDF